MSENPHTKAPSLTTEDGESFAAKVVLSLIGPIADLGLTELEITLPKCAGVNNERGAITKHEVNKKNAKKLTKN